MANVVPTRYIDDYGVSRVEREVIHVSEVLFSSAFKFDFYNIKLIQLWDTHLSKPVKRIHFIAITRAAGAIVLASSRTS
jgi:hypothetical protein